MELATATSQREAAKERALERQQVRRAQRVIGEPECGRVMGSRQRTGRIARFEHKIGTRPAGAPVPIELVFPGPRNHLILLMHLVAYIDCSSSGTLSETRNEVVIFCQICAPFR